MTKIDTTKMTKAVRFRIGDYVQGKDLETSRWFIGKVVGIRLGQDEDEDGGVCTAEDNQGQSHTSITGETYKATKKQFTTPSSLCVVEAVAEVREPKRIKAEETKKPEAKKLPEDGSCPLCGGSPSSQTYNRKG